MPPRPSGSTMRYRSASTSPGRKRAVPAKPEADRAAEPDERRRLPPGVLGAVPVATAEEESDSSCAHADPSPGSGREQTVQLATALLQPELAGAQLLQPVADQI